MIRRVFSKAAKHWYLYVIWLIAIVLVWDVIFALVTRVPAEEKVEIFVGAYHDDYSDLTRLCESNMPVYLKKVNIRRFDADQKYFSEMLQVQGSVADIFILPASKVAEAKIYYLPLDAEKVEQTFGNVELYKIDASAYGIKLPNSDAQENYYLLFSNTSAHLGSWNDSSMDGALALAEVILGYEDE